MAQKFKTDDLSGCWKFSRFEFLKPMPDSTNFINETKDYLVCFEGIGKFTTKQKTNDGEKMIGEGTFNIEKDGRTLTQKRNTTDGDIDEQAELVTITKQEMVLKVGGDIIIHFERTGDSK